jgi:hypothetical protein
MEEGPYRRIHQQRSAPGEHARRVAFPKGAMQANKEAAIGLPLKHKVAREPQEPSSE